MTANVGMKTGWVFYDAECVWCRTLARHCERLLQFHGYTAVPLQTHGVAEWLGVSEDELRSKMYIFTGDGQRFAGADAYVALARARGWSRPLAWFGSLPFVLPHLRRLYQWIAARRPCDSGNCRARLARRRGAFAVWPPLLVGALATLGLLLSFRPAPWLVMWILAFSLFAACKWLTLQEAVRHGVSISRSSALRYLIGWVGMEPREFAVRGTHPAAIAPWTLVRTLGRIFLGAGLTWGLVRFLVDMSPLAAGWVGMIGIILLLHFGTFDLLALGWRRAGYNVTPLMNAPTRAHSVGNFWGVRWNRGFNALARRFLHEPIAGRWGRGVAVFAVFAISGLIHDFVITVPAGGGYGLPTAYFLLQGVALLFERSRAGRRLGLGRGLRGRIFGMAVVAGPAFWLFPPVFVRHVILPMLHAIGAT